MSLGVFEEPGARVEVPHPPRRDDFDVGGERIIAELETDLVVPLASRAVRDGIGADLAGNFDLPLRDQRARDRGAEEIGALVKRIGAEHREDKIADELLAQIVDKDLTDAEHLRLLARRFELFALTQIGGECHNLAAIGFLQPAQDYRCVEPAGVRKNDLFHRVGHATVPPNAISGCPIRRSRKPRTASIAPYRPRSSCPPSRESQNSFGCGAASNSARPKRIGTTRSRSPCKTRIGALTSPILESESKRSRTSAAAGMKE